ncbi:MAG: hypothetical protein HQ569_03545 [Actinobacteria bacterium]|nr:hypothetical protein [Actinomycetota bacterium]
MSIAPVAFFAYNRPWHTQKSLESLLSNDLSSLTELFIFSDAPNNIETQEAVFQVRKYFTAVKGFKNINIIEREKNFGLANSIKDKKLQRKYVLSGNDKIDMLIAQRQGKIDS